MFLGGRVCYVCVFTIVVSRAVLWFLFWCVEVCIVGCFDLVDGGEMMV